MEKNKKKVARDGSEDTLIEISSISPILATSLDRSLNKLYKGIFDSQYPEKVVNSLSPLETTLLIAKEGPENVPEILQMLSKDKLKAFVNSFLWDGDQLIEDNLWSLLKSAINEPALLNSLIEAIEPTTVAILFAKYISSQVSPEPTEEPPTKEYFTLDKGHTWLRIIPNDEDKYVLLKHIIEDIFGRDPRLFYQLLHAKDSFTVSELEEAAYSEHRKMMNEAGFPDYDTAHEINVPLRLWEIKEATPPSMYNQKKAERSGDSFKQLVQKRSKQAYPFDRLLELFQEVRKHRDLLTSFQEEFALIFNSAVICFAKRFSNYDAVSTTLNQVKGAINIGLEYLEDLVRITPKIELYKTFHLIKIYRAGLAQIFPVRNMAQRTLKATKDKGVKLDTLSEQTLEYLCKPFPLMAGYLLEEEREKPVPFAAKVDLDIAKMWLEELINESALDVAVN